MTDLDKALWRAVVTEDVAGLALAAANGANTESQVSDLALNSAFTARRVFSETEQNKTTEEQAQAWSFVLDYLTRDTLPSQSDTRTPLLTALLHDLFEIAVALLSAGADPNHAANSGLTPLLVAVRKGDTEAAKALLAAGANPNQAMPWVPHETQGHSPLVRAAGDGNLSMVQLLLAHGAEVNAPDSAGRTALLAACARPSGIFWTDLRERMNLDAETEESTGIGRFMLGKSPLEEAEPVGDWSEIIELLLSKGAYVNAETPASSPHAVLLEVSGTPLLKAAQRGDAALIARLLASGASPRPTCGTTPLHAALFQPAGSSTEAVERLLNARASITERDSDGSSPAGCAIRTGNLAGLKLLIGAGLDLQTRNPEFGTTLLHAAAQSGQVEIAQYLLDSGLELDATGTAPSPAERQAERDKIRSQVEQGREEAGVDRGLPELPGHLLQAPQGEPDTERPTGITPLMLAAGANKADMVRLLLERGADPNRRDSKGKTARDYALRTEATEQRQRAFLSASQFNVLESPQLKDTMEQLPDDSFRDDLTKQLAEMQSNFGAMMEKMLSGKRDAREETLALLPE